ncbi:MAG: hypothetical protein JWP16_1672 [Alphaproteobacteria bacterium]|nr:hypothetical protein [Alphaproteobacteria bacterium]MDB5740632.1 hypothetical protein [Alphaproteobacteria bacterium]
MGKLGVMLVILVLGAAILSPLVIAFEPDPMPGDFSFMWGHTHIAVPVLWSLCASGTLALFYAFMKR